MRAGSNVRRSLMAVTAIALCTLTFTTLGWSADWPNWRNASNNTAAAAETINLPLTERWHSQAPDVEENGAVVANGIVYMSSEPGTLYAFELTTGFTVPGYPVNTAANYGTPAVDQTTGRVYVLAGGTLFAFNLDGTPAWTKSVGVTGYNFNEGPVVDTGYVYVKAGGTLQKYDAAGNLVWSTASGGGDTQAAIMGGFVYTNAENGSIHKYDIMTGLEVTTGGFPIATAGSEAALTVVNDKIFHKANELYVYSAFDGSLVWQQPCGGTSNYYGSPAVADGVVYIYGWDGALYAFDENTGATKIGFPTGNLNPGQDRNYGSVSVAGNKLFIGAGQSQRMKVVGAAGTVDAGVVLAELPTFSTDTQGFDLCSPIISDGWVLIMLDGGGLYAFSASGIEPPSGAIIINDNAPCTESADVTLTLDNNGNSAITEMRISEDSTFTGVAFEPYAPTKPWTLSAGFGTKTVYAQYRDNTGQLSNVFNDQIDYLEACQSTGTLTITCLDPTAMTDTGVCSATVPCDTIATCKDDTGASFAVTCVPGSPYPLGSSQVTVSCGSGETATTKACGLSVRDLELPTLECPPDASLQCPTDTSTSATGTATASDNCDTPEVGSSDQSVPGCGTTETITRDWTATDGSGNTAECEQTVAVVDLVAPTGAITGPPNGACYGPNGVPVTVTDDFADACGGPISKSYEPPQGPTHAAHGDYPVTLTAADACQNSADASVFFTIDLVAPQVSFLPRPRSFIFPRLIPFNTLFSATDDDGATGGTVHEWISVDGCVVYDGFNFGDNDGVLSDESLPANEDEMCRLVRMCNQRQWTDPVVRVSAADCGGNLTTEALVVRGRFKLAPGRCGEATLLPSITNPGGSLKSLQ